VGGAGWAEVGALRRRCDGRYASAQGHVIQNDATSHHVVGWYVRISENEGHVNDDNHVVGKYNSRRDDM